MKVCVMSVLMKKKNKKMKDKISQEELKDKIFEEKVFESLKKFIINLKKKQENERWTRKPKGHAIDCGISPKDTPSMVAGCFIIMEEK